MWGVSQALLCKKIYYFCDSDLSLHTLYFVSNRFRSIFIDLYSFRSAINLLLNELFEKNNTYYSCPDYLMFLTPPDFTKGNVS